MVQQNITTDMMKVNLMGTKNQHDLIMADRSPRKESKNLESQHYNDNVLDLNS